MTISRDAAGTSLFTTVAATSHNVPYPTGILAGHLLVLFATTNGGAVTNPASPWVTVYREGTLANPKGGLWIKVATGSESGTLAVATSSTTGSFKMWRYSGVDTTTPQDATATTVVNSVASGSSVLPSLTTVTAGAVLLYGGGNNSSTNTETGPGTEVWDSEQENATSPKSGALYEETIASPGATGTRTITISTSRENWAVMCALRPSGAAPAAQNVAIV